MTLRATPFSTGNALLLLLQIVLILVVARVTAALFRSLGPSSVVGEMIGGLLLGPSVFGVLAPAPFAWLFPPDSLTLVRAVSQIGILVFMFVVGTEFDMATLRPQSPCRRRRRSRRPHRPSGTRGRAGRCPYTGWIRRGFR
jgi:hypothetical protein